MDRKVDRNSKHDDSPGMQLHHTWGSQTETTSLSDMGGTCEHSWRASLLHVSCVSIFAPIEGVTILNTIILILLYRHEIHTIQVNGDVTLSHVPLTLILSTEDCQKRETCFCGLPVLQNPSHKNPFFDYFVPIAFSHSVYVDFSMNYFPDQFYTPQINTENYSEVKNSTCINHATL